MINRSAVVHWVALLALVFMWGASFAVLKLALESVGPYWIAAMRIALAALMLGAISIQTGARLPHGKAEWAVVGALGLVGNSLPFLLIGWATNEVPSGVSGLMMATSPILVMLFSILALPEERASLLRIIGLVLGFLGVAMVIIGRTDAALDGQSQSIWPYIALLGGAACYACSTVVGRKFGAMPVLTRSFWALTIGGVASIIVAFWVEPVPGSVSTTSILAIVYLAAVPTALATIMVLWLLGQSSAGFVAQSNYMVPIAAVVVGALAFGEQLGMLQYGGMVTVLVGIAIAERWAKRKV